MSPRGRWTKDGVVPYTKAEEFKADAWEFILTALVRAGPGGYIASLFSFGPYGGFLNVIIAVLLNITTWAGAVILIRHLI